ncbi:MAG: SCO family protein [Lautropia sp.]|nr:SCO family protein [Lautropia sp.]
MFRKWCALACLCGLMVFASGVASARQISFELQDDKGVVTHESYPGKYLMLAIGFTSCPDICPTTLYEYAGVMQSLKNPDAIQPIFVTIDPVNDDPARLNAYTRFFDERIVGLGGDRKNIKALVDQLGATYGYRKDGKRLESPEQGDGYTVYHSALIYLISPDRELVDVFDYQIGSEGLTEALDKVLGEPSKPAGKPPASTS